MTRPPRLSKSRYQYGLQCPKRLWLTCFLPELARPYDEATLAMFEQGHRVGALAQKMFPGGVLVAEDHTQVEEALTTTARLLADGVSCLYEPAFLYDGVLVRPDVIVHGTDWHWHLIEVKSSSSLKDEYVTDAAIQTNVLEGAGLPVGRTSVLHLNKEYVHTGGPYNLAELFTLADLTAEVRAYLPEIPDRLVQLREILIGDCPEPLIGRQCSSPYACPFAEHCHAFLPEFPVTDIPRLRAELLREFLLDGIYAAKDVPAGHPALSPGQRAVCECIRERRPRYGRGLAAALEGLRFPLHFLDFETMMPALPLYAGTRPYQVLPFQWSCHTLDDCGELHHREFLHEGRSDPRRPFAQALLTALRGDRGSILVYSSFEHTRLNELAGALPDLADRIRRLQARLVDLMQIVSEHVQHPDFHGSRSLKRVLPALAPDLSYEDLEIQDGRLASNRYLAAILEKPGTAERCQTFAALRAYCTMDTMALVRVFEELCLVAG